jgi:undecaprenyl-diphosphatase
MTIVQSLILGALQGLTEFLPVSSSGHLVLAEHLLQLDVANLLSFDIVVHTGTLLALLMYFRKTWGEVFRELFTPKLWKQSLLLKLIIATIPAVIVALIFKDAMETIFRGTQSVFIALFATAILLSAGELLGRKKSDTITFGHAILMGCMQAIAIIPGISRSGATITGGMFGNLTRESAARFSFLMAVPAIGGAFVFALKEALTGEMILPATSVMSAGFFSSFLVSLICIHYFLKFIRKYPLYIFSIYLLAISAWGLANL